MRVRHLVPILLAASLSGCACRQCTNPLPPAPAPTAAKAEGLPNDLHWSRNSAEKRALFHQTYRQATDSIERLAEGREPRTWAVSLDADETIIDNSPFQIEMNAAGKTFNIEDWNAWCRRGEATALPGAIEFMERVQELGGYVLIVTNRGVEVQAETEENFRAIGIPYDFAILKTSTSNKNPRYDAITAGNAAEGLPPVEVVMWIGDNIDDFPHTGQDIRKAGDNAFAHFGERFIVLPNPMYGSWQRVPME